MEIPVKQRYINFPVKTGALKRWVLLRSGTQTVREFEIELAEGQPDWWAYLDAAPWLGKSLTLEFNPALAKTGILEDITQSAEPLERKNFYHEKHRPQFHFSPCLGWMNDPNGLVYYQGEYHLFFQHNPYGTAWGNMHWGHAVSRDLLHWRQLPEALYPDQHGVVYSGSGVVDHQNTAGYQLGQYKTLAFLYTAAGGLNPSSQGQPFTQCLAYSTDRGITFSGYAQNPVLANITNQNRDPKVVWHAPTRRWIMALYKDANDYALFHSPDLKTWTHLHDLTLPGCSECPDFFELKVEGETHETRWIFTAANGRYLLGAFDGQRFIPESGLFQVDYGANFYAVQTYSDAPNGRRIQLAWMNGGAYPGMPFNQQMSFPCELKLLRTPAGLRLLRTPSPELKELHSRRHTWNRLDVPTGNRVLNGPRGGLYHIHQEIDAGSANEFGLVVQGARISYNCRDHQLTCLGRAAPLELENDHLTLDILVDRTCLELFANQGRVSFTSCFIPGPEDQEISLFSLDGTTRIKTLQVYELKPIW